MQGRGRGPDEHSFIGPRRPTLRLTLITGIRYHRAVHDEQRLLGRARALEREALADLTPEQQDILALRFGYGMPIKDVAETVNKSEGSVKMLQVRAIAALTKRLTGSGIGDQ